ncbi:MAG: hypothetical protein GY798_07245 [Hyphomicrobiales bacterium]|nr:hypothetical protein [Hyphomicrobiales bacterium]
MTFNDDSIVGHGLELLAETMNAPKDKIREQFAGALPFFLSMGTASNPELGRLIRESGFLDELTPAVSEFIAMPESSITIEARPAESVPVMQLGAAMQTAPGTLIDVLGLSVSSRAPESAPAETVTDEPMVEEPMAEEPMTEDGGVTPEAAQPPAE